ncbi:non-ribosomal peptide synthetase [Stigmatella aurantiaca]|nr:non-ribosomal peptide synthetase [Stigmatella aurantiaca]
MPLNRQPLTLIELLEEKASLTPDQPLFTFQEETEGEEKTLSYGELRYRALTIARSVQALAAPGERALLLYPPGLEYIAGFFGCLYAGMVAVPAYPPDPLRLNRTLPRLRAMIQDAQAKVVLTTSFILSMGESLFEQEPDFKNLHWIATDDLPKGAPDRWVQPSVSGNTLAFLQYTSGSTGAPKGVMLTHDNLLCNLEMIAHTFQIRSDSVCVIWLPPYHDMGLIGGILEPVYTGMRTTLMSPMSFLKNPFRWLDTISRLKATVSGGPNFAFDLCVRKVTAEQRQRLDLSHWKVAFSGAEPIRPETLDRFTQTFETCGFRRKAFFPCYGLAEATLIVSGGEVPEPPILCSLRASALEQGQAVEAPSGELDSRTLVGCGQTVPNQEILIVDPVSSVPCPPGKVGEIWVCGPSVAQGYWQKPTETGQIFQARPASGGERVYLRTGDLGFLKERELFVTGRQKDLIIIRGRNHFPQDLELTAEQSHPSLRPGCSAAFSVDWEGEEKLVLVQEVDVRKAGDLRAQLDVCKAAATALRQRLAEVHEVQLHALALIEPGTIFKTSSGKIQRSACREAFLSGALQTVLKWETSNRAVQPRAVHEAAPPPLLTAAPTDLSTEEGLQSWLVAHVAKQLRIPATSLDPAMPLTGYGLDSLAAVELAHSLEKGLGFPISMELLLQGSSLAQLARQFFTQRPQEAKDHAPLVSQLPRNNPLPLSYAQQRLWFLDQLEPGSPRYIIPAAVRIEGALNVPLLEHSFLLLALRHEPLRTTFLSSPQGPSQLISPSSSFQLQHFDLRSLPPHLRDARLLSLCSELSLLPFSLSQGPLLRACLLHLDEHLFVLFLSMHHIISDGWSMGVLVRELASLYQSLLHSAPSTLPDLPFQYADFASWQRSWLLGPRLLSQLAWWREHLCGAPLSLHLPTDFPRPPVLSSRGASVPVLLPASLSRSLHSLCLREGVTPFMALIAVFQLLLSRYSAQDDICVGFPIANRNLPSLEGLIGFFANTLLLRSRLPPDSSFLQLLSQVRSSSLGAYAHQDVPFDKLVEAMNPERDLSRSPLFQAMFSLQNTPVLELDEVHLHLRQLELESQTCLFDLMLSLEDTGTGFAGKLHYSTDLFTAATASQMARHFLVLMEGLLNNPDQHLSEVSLLTPQERQQLLEEWSGTAPLASSLCLHHLFEAQVARSPDAIALVVDSTRLSYRELNRRANQLAHCLQALGASPDVPIGLCLQRSTDMVIGLLAILKAGAAYVPLDPAYPAERLIYSFQDAGASLLVTQDTLRHLLPIAGAKTVCLDSGWEPISRESTDNPRSSVLPSNLAYVLYTSGSTGRPKGVAIEHHNAAVFIQWSLNCFSAQQLAGVLASTSICFDLSIFELFAPLCSGGTVLLASNALALPSLPAAQEVTLINTVPSAIAELARTNAIPSSIHTLNLAGEPLSGSLVRALYSLPSIQHVFNLYGPTEDTTYSTFTLIPKDASSEPTIGRPISGTRAYVLDRQLHLVPRGVPGELYLSGSGLARGYINRPELTAERFLPNPFSTEPGSRLYKTGDLARFAVDGNLEYLGRIDHQVKIRGFRIELGEIESILLTQPGLHQAAVLAHEEAPGDKRLVAYVVAARNHSFTPAELRRLLKERLPDYMVPSAFVLLDALPLTPNGKLDRKALPRPGAPSLEQKGFVPPHTQTEKALAEMWCELLNIDRVGIQDHFFELGGHSLLASQVISRIRSALGVELPLRSLFESPSLESFATAVDSALNSPQAPQLPQRLPPQSRPGPLPLSYAQQRLWFLDQLEPGSPRYIIPAAVRIEGALNVPLLEHSFLLLALRHEPLRTTFLSSPQGPSQLISLSSSFQLQHFDLRSLPPHLRDARLLSLCSELSLLPFSLSQGPLLRACLLHLDEHLFVLFLSMHHIISDGWSMGVLVRELASLYQSLLHSAPSTLPDLPFQYADFASWQRSWLLGPRLLSQLAWWREHLRGAPLSLHLPTDFPRPPVLSSRGASVPVLLPASLSRSLHSLCLREGVTPFMALIAVFQLLLSRYSAQDDICVGFPIANRNLPSLEGLIGFFANTLLLRSRLPRDSSFLQLLSQVRSSSLGAYAHQDVPFDKLVEAMNPERDLSRSPLFQAMFSLQNTPVLELALPELVLHPMELPSQTAKFELLLSLSEDTEGFSGILEYNTDLFTAATISQMAEHFCVLLEDVLAHPERRLDQLSPLFSPEEHPLLVKRHDRELPQQALTEPPPSSVAALPLSSIHLTLVDIWKEVLSLQHVGIHDDFFTRGGNSISSILVVARLQEAGLHLSPDQIFQKRTIAELAPLVTSARKTEGQGEITGALPLTPIQRWFFDTWEQHAHHFNQAVMLEVLEDIEAAVLEGALQKLLEHHDALRLRFERTGDGWRQENGGAGRPIALKQVDVSGLTQEAQTQTLAKVAEEEQESFDLAEGQLLRAVLFHRGQGRTGRLLLVIHHLGVDGLSWRTLIEDLEKAYKHLSSGGEAVLGTKTTSFKTWAEHLELYAGTQDVEEQLPYWEKQGQEEVGPLPVDKAVGANTVVSEDRVTVRLEEEETRALLQEVPTAYGTRVEEVLLAALTATMGRWTGLDRISVSMEGHGREELFEDVDLSRTVGWFTSLYPMVLDTGKAERPEDKLQAVSNRLKGLPMKGLGYGLLRYLGRDEIVKKLERLSSPELLFNYLGEFDASASRLSMFRPTREETGPARSREGLRSHLLEVNGLVFDWRLELTWSYSQNRHERATIERLAQGFMSELRGFIDHQKTAIAHKNTPANESLSVRLEQVTQGLIHDQQMLGTALLVELADRRRVHMAKGTSDPAGTPYTQTTRVLIGSLTKMFTAVAILQLVEDGRLSLDATVNEWLPWLMRGKAITLRDLLAHTSGLPDYLSRLTLLDTAKPCSPRSLVELAEHEPAVPPGHYSNTNYIVLGLLLEALTGSTWEEEISRRILEPLGLIRTTPLTESPPEDLVGAWKRGDDGWKDIRPVWHPSCGWAAGGMISTTEELVTFGRALFSGALFKSPDTLAAMRSYSVSSTPHMAVGVEHEMGLCLHLFRVAGITLEGHLGERPGYSAVLLHDPETQAIVAATANTHGALTAFAGVKALEAVRRATS